MLIYSKSNICNDYARKTINDTDITTATRGITDISSWSGSYFAGTTQTVTAVAQAIFE